MSIAKDEAQKNKGTVKVLDSEVQSERAGKSDESNKVDSGGNSNFVTLTHLVKALIGPPILAIPCAFKDGGWAFSGPCCAALFILIAHNIKRLIQSAAHLSERESIPVRTYAEVAYVSFETCSDWTKHRATIFKHIINVLFVITYLDACIIFMIFVSWNVEALIRYYYPETFLTIRYCIFFQVMLLMSMSSIRQLRYLTPFSFIASALIISVAFCLAGVYFIQDMDWKLAFEERRMIGRPTSIVQFICVVLFCMSGISIALTLKSSMKNQKHYFSPPGIYYIAITGTTTIFVSFGMLGYLKYGEDTQPSILFNIPMQATFSIFVRIIAVLSVLLTSPLVFYVAFNILWSNFIKPYLFPINLLFTEYCVRFSLITFCYVVATIYPELRDMIVLKGALFHSHLEITIPAILEFVTFYPEMGTGKYHGRLFKAICIAACGASFCIAGICVSILNWTEVNRY